MVVHLAAAEAQVAPQLRMIEEMREQLGEEAYQEMKRATEMSTAMMKSQREAWAQMPEPTASERALLETYRDDLTVMMDDGEEEEWEEEWEDEDAEDQ